MVVRSPDYLLSTIGSLVLVGNDKSVEMQIVDGQQRLTTLTELPVKQLS